MGARSSVEHGSGHLARHRAGCRPRWSRWFTELGAPGHVRDRRRLACHGVEPVDGDPLRAVRPRDVVGRSLFELYPELATRGARRVLRGRAGGPRSRVISHGLHRYVLPLPPTNPDLDFTEMPQSGHIGPLVDGGRSSAPSRSSRTSAIGWPAEAELRKQIEAQQRGAGDGGAGPARQGRVPVDAVARDADAAERRARVGADSAGTQDRVDPELLDAGPARHRAQRRRAGAR